MIKLQRLLLLAVSLTLPLAPGVLAQESQSSPAASPVAAPVAQFTAAKAPAVIYLMRHAEKPEGTDKNPDLTSIGFHRADLLPSLFLSRPGAPARLLRPQYLFATARSKHSNRPVETITPLSIALNLTINKDFEDHDTAGIAREVLGGKYAGKVVLIAWHHGELPHLAEALGITSPEKWQDTTFNVIWKVQYDNGAATLTPVPQALLPGDPPATP